MSKVIEITDKKEFEEKILNSDKVALVDFWAPWCMPCRMISPLLDQLVEQVGDEFIIAKVDTTASDNQDLAAEYNIQSIPNMKIIKGGKVVDEVIGMTDIATLKEKLSNNK